MSNAKLLDSQSTAAVVLGASDWTEAGLGRASSFLRSARSISKHLVDSAGLNLDPTLVIDLFDDPASAGEQLARVRDTLDELLRERRAEGRPVADLLVYYIGHGYTDDEGHLSMLVRRSRKGLEAETGMKAPDLARVLRVAAPQQRRLIILDCCFSEAAVRAFIGMSGALDQAVAAVAAKDVSDAFPKRGGVLLCSSPKGEISVGPPNAERTLFTDAVLKVLKEGITGGAPVLSFADLRDAAHHCMIEAYGVNAPRPALHPVNQSQGDLTRLPAFQNRAAVTNDKPQSAPPIHKYPKKIHQVTQLQSKPLLLPRQWLILGVCASIATATWIGWSIVGHKPPPTGLPAPLQPAAALAPPPNSNSDAIYELGLQRTREGHHAEATRLYRVAADQGNAAAQNTLGVLYEDGRGGLPQDDAKAVELYRSAADQKNAKAQTSLGIFYELGRGGLSRDEAQAAHLYRLAADQGEPAAQSNLGQFYEQGRGGLPRDEAQAAELYRRAADRGYAAAQVKLGRFYEQGRGGLPRDEAQAAEFYLRAADQGNATAQTNLGRFHELGRGGVLRDDAQAIHLYRLAADRGDAVAQSKLGAFYELGSGGLPQDDAQAAHFYRLAADRGEASAQNKLGIFYEQGRGGLPRNESEAARLYRLAADKGETSAQANLGRFYERGRGGLTANLTEAIRWYQAAARNGSTNAQQSLRRLNQSW